MSPISSNYRPASGLTQIIKVHDVGRHCAAMAVAVLFGEQESAEQVNCIVSSMHQAGPLYPQLLTYRCGAANRRFGPVSDLQTEAR
jgi:hypothetical protein